MPKHIRRLPDSIRRALTEARHERGLSQAEVGRRVGLPQAHISGIESGKIVPRFDTLLEIVRVVDHDLLMVPRELVPAVQALARGDQEERPLYLPDEDQDGE